MVTEQALQLSFEARPESLGAARRRVAAFARRLGMAESALADLMIVVGEACSNVVRHAYPDEDRGRFEVEAAALDGDLVVVVRDFGRGMRPQIRDPDSLRLGLALIATLSSHFEISVVAGGGTEVRARMPLRGGVGC
jgi:serine/threonine-protein kinase RsbW